MSRFARACRVVVVVAAAAVARPAAATPVAHLAANPATGTAPLVVGFDSARSQAGTIAEHLLLLGNGDAIALTAAEQMANYNYTMPGFYLAQTWLRDDSGIALAPPVAIRVARQRDGRAPATATVTVSATTDPATFAFAATVMAPPDDPVVARRWDFGDGNTAGDAAPFHAYAQPGVYQAALLATTRAGLPLYGRVVVLVRDAAGALGPSLLLTATPENSSLLTPVDVRAFIQGVAPDAKISGAAIGWPDFVDVSPTVTQTAAGITVASQHAPAAAGSYDVPVTVQLAGQPAPLVASVRLTVGNIDGSAPSPVLLLPPATSAVSGVAYSPGTTSGALLVAGDGPFAFGVAAPSPSNFAVDDAGRISWTPTRAQLGFARLAVRIVDAQGRQTIASWVVEVAAPKKSGCAMVPGAPPVAASVAWPLWLALGSAVAVVARRRGRRGVAADRFGTTA